MNLIPQFFWISQGVRVHCLGMTTKNKLRPFTEKEAAAQEEAFKHFGDPKVVVHQINSTDDPNYNAGDQ